MLDLVSLGLGVGSNPVLGDERDTVGFLSASFFTVAAQPRQHFQPLCSPAP